MWALGPKMMRSGDEVRILFGGSTFLILRPMHDHYVFVGDRYIDDHDIMRGKAIEIGNGTK